MNKEDLISEMLRLPMTAIDYEISKSLVTLFPDMALIECDAGQFNVEGYARAGLCTLTRKSFTYNQMVTHWRMREPEMMPWHHARIVGPMMGSFAGMMQTTTMAETPSGEDTSDTMDSVRKAWLEAVWQGKTLDVLTLQIQGGNFHLFHHWILAETQETARRFFAAVCKWQAEIRSEELVFDNGGWYKDEHLFQDIKGATFDNLILRGSLKQDIRHDLEQFFASRAIYEEHDVPWKRGILFVGPAGNGKTHAVKALINSLEQPRLYVKSFRAPQTGMADEYNIRQVFDRARRTSPCVLVIEDLDAVITPQNRSFFLNELDGFAANTGGGDLLAPAWLA